MVKLCDGGMWWFGIVSIHAHTGCVRPHFFPWPVSVWLCIGHHKSRHHFSTLQSYVSQCVWLCVCTRYMVDVDAAGWWPPWLLLFFFSGQEEGAHLRFFFLQLGRVLVMDLEKSPVFRCLSPLIARPINNQRLQSWTFSYNEKYRISQPITFNGVGYEFDK